VQADRRTRAYGIGDGPDRRHLKRTHVQGKFPKLLDDTSAVVPPASVEGVGKVYRLKAGSFPTQATAADVCAQLMAAQQVCLVVKRRGLDSQPNFEP